MSNQIDYSNFTLKQDISENDLAIIVWTFILANVVRNFGFSFEFQYICWCIYRIHYKTAVFCDNYFQGIHTDNWISNIHEGTHHQLPHDMTIEFVIFVSAIRFWSHLRPKNHHPLGPIIACKLSFITFTLSLLMNHNGRGLRNSVFTLKVTRIRRLPGFPGLKKWLYNGVFILGPRIIR